MNPIYKWYKINTLLQKNEEEALVFILSNLVDHFKDLEYLDKFLKYGLKELMNPDVIVHIINTIHTIKDKLPHWDKFIEHSKILLLEQIREERTNRLIKIMDI